MTIPYYTGELPWLSTRQMVEVDRAMIEDYGIQLVQMMENAGRALALVAKTRFLGGSEGILQGKRITVLAGTGGNGGGGLVCARRLHAWGAEAHVVTTKPAEGYDGIPAQQLETIQRLSLNVERLPPSEPDLVIDSLIGYSLTGAPRGRAAELIDWANAQPAPVLALDTPSGLDTSSGTAYEPTVRATATLTLALPKEGLRAEGAESYVGELYLADISVPPQLYAQPPLGLNVKPMFAESDVLRLK